MGIERMLEKDKPDTVMGLRFLSNEVKTE